MNRLFRWGIFIALLVLAASSFIAIRMVFGDNNGATVPPLVGASAVDATNLLQSAGLLARIDQVDSNSPEGTVIAQSISPGEQTDRGKIVTIKVSRGGAQVKIPDVRNNEYPAAVQELEAAGLKVGTVIRVSDQLKQPNIVIAQNPAAPATVMNNRMVDLLVSEGGTGREETVQVPDLRGETEAHARQILAQSNLAMSKVLTQETNQFPEGSVVRTDPRAGTRVPTGRAVSLYIAKAQEPAAQVQPQVQPQTQTQTQAQAPPLDTPPQANVTQGAGQAAETPTWNPNQPAQLQTSSQQPAPATQPVQQQTQQQPGQSQIPSPIPVPQPGDKVARVRYQVPPLARPLDLNIAMNDQSGTRTLRQQQVQGGEYVSIDVPYSGIGTVTVRLGNQQVWQERYN
ncbi:MAG: PASTA domain-containing protein [Synergistaceae bacterium]|nr:PASTA domain-containing protein [Synergistaceae bacterium]